MLGWHHRADGKLNRNGVTMVLTQARSNPRGRERVVTGETQQSWHDDGRGKSHSYSANIRIRSCTMENQYHGRLIQSIALSVDGEIEVNPGKEASNHNRLRSESQPVTALEKRYKRYCTQAQVPNLWTAECRLRNKVERRHQYPELVFPTAVCNGGGRRCPPTIQGRGGGRPKPKNRRFVSGGPLLYSVPTHCSRRRRLWLAVQFLCLDSNRPIE